MSRKVLLTKIVLNKVHFWLEINNQYLLIPVCVTLGAVSAISPDLTLHHHIRGSMANTGSVSVRVFSLNCWSVTVVWKCLFMHFFQVVTHFWKLKQKHIAHAHCLFFRGIHYLSKHCLQRYAMIGDMLSKEEHDIVLLQEVCGSQFIIFWSCIDTSLVDFPSWYVKFCLFCNEIQPKS